MPRSSLALAYCRLALHSRAVQLIPQRRSWRQAHSLVRVGQGFFVFAFGRQCQPPLEVQNRSVRSEPNGGCKIRDRFCCFSFSIPQLGPGKKIIGRARIGNIRCLPRPSLGLPRGNRTRAARGQHQHHESQVTHRSHLNARATTPKSHYHHRSRPRLPPQCATRRHDKSLGALTLTLCLSMRTDYDPHSGINPRACFSRITGHSSRPVLAPLAEHENGQHTLGPHLSSGVRLRNFALRACHGRHDHGTNARPNDRIVRCPGHRRRPVGHACRTETDQRFRAQAAGSLLRRDLHSGESRSVGRLYPRRGGQVAVQPLEARAAR